MYMQSLLVSGGSDGLLVLWSADNALDSRELVPKLSLKVSSYSLSFILLNNYCNLISSSKIFIVDAKSTNEKNSACGRIDQINKAGVPFDVFPLIYQLVVPSIR